VTDFGLCIPAAGATLFWNQSIVSSPTDAVTPLATSSASHIPNLLQSALDMEAGARTSADDAIRVGAKSGGLTTQEVQQVGRIFKFTSKKTRGQHSDLVESCVKGAGDSAVCEAAGGRIESTAEQDSGAGVGLLLQRAGKRS